MLRQMRLAAGALAVLVGGFVLAQQPAPPAPAGDPSGGLYPLKKGSKWVYKTGDQTVEVVVAGPDKDGTKLDTLVNGKSVASEVVQVKADGVYRVSVKGDKVDPPVKFLALPAKKGEAWKVDSKVGTQTVKGEFKTADDKAKIKVGDKEYEAVYVECPECDVAGAKSAIKYWFAKDKGVVKLSYSIQNTEAVLELKDYVEGK